MCPEGDSNPHVRSTHVPQTCLSTNFSTRASDTIFLVKELTLSQVHDFYEFAILAQLAFFLQKTLVYQFQHQCWNNRTQKYIFFWIIKIGIILLLNDWFNSLLNIFDLSTSVSDRRFQFSGYEISQIMNDQSWNHLNINQGQI